MQTITKRPCFDTYSHAIKAVAQSTLIHPTWSLEYHLDYLAQDGFDLDKAITITRDGLTRTHPLRRFVESWVKFPARCQAVANAIWNPA